MSDEYPSYKIEKDSVGLGNCVIALWADGRRIVVTGFGSATDAEKWIERDSAEWLKGIPRDVSADQWVNDRLPKA